MSPIDVRGMIEAGRCVSWAACEIDSRPDERDDRERRAEQQMLVGRPVERHRVHQQLGVEREEEAEEENRRLADDVERRDDAVQRGRLAHAHHVQNAQARDQTVRGDEMNPGVLREREDRQQLTEIVYARPGEQRDVDREIEQHGPAGDEAEHITEPAQHEILAAAGDRIRRRELGVREADADVDDAREEEGDVRAAPGGAEHEPEADEDVGADIAVAPREGAPRRDGTPERRFGRHGLSACGSACAAARRGGARPPPVP